GGVVEGWGGGVGTGHRLPRLAVRGWAVINVAGGAGGGSGAVEGPLGWTAARSRGADLGKAAMAIAYGEAWTNMAEPFWALPALAIAGLGVRDIMGYCVTTLLFSGVVFVAGMYLF
ncbi:short-chain fatty acid transporter, partial [Burkholderia contaminans]